MKEFKCLDLFYIKSKHATKHAANTCATNRLMNVKYFFQSFIPEIKQLVKIHAKVFTSEKTTLTYKVWGGPYKCFAYGPGADLDNESIDS